MFKIIKKSEFQWLKIIEDKYSNQCIQLQNIHDQLQTHKIFLSKFTRKLNGTKAFIFDIKNSNEKIESYICVIDSRDHNLNGNLNIFVMNTEIHISKTHEKYIDMPFMQTTFYSDKITIDELRCDIENHNYEGKGYGRMMLDTLKYIALKSERLKITGYLSEKDAHTEEKKERRNNFYIRHGFILEFDDETHKSGSISITLLPKT